MVIFVFALPAFIGAHDRDQSIASFMASSQLQSAAPEYLQNRSYWRVRKPPWVSAYYMLIGLGRARDVAYCTAIQFMVNAVVLLAIAFWFKHVTVGEAAAAFGVATASATLYLRIRLRYVLRPKDALPDSIVLIRSGADF